MTERILEGVIAYLAGLFCGAEALDGGSWRDVAIVAVFGPIVYAAATWFNYRVFRR